MCHQIRLPLFAPSPVHLSPLPCSRAASYRHFAKSERALLGNLATWLWKNPNAAFIGQSGTPLAIWQTGVPAPAFITLSRYQFITPTTHHPATAAQPPPTANNPRPAPPACLRARAPELYHLEKIGPARRKASTMDIRSILNAHLSPMKFLTCSPLTYHLSPRSGPSGYQNPVHINPAHLITCPQDAIPHGFLSDRLSTWGNAARRRDRSRANPSRITGAPPKADLFRPPRHLATGNTKRETPFVSDRPLFDPARIRLPGQARPGEAAARGGEAGPPTYSVRQVNELVRGALLRHLPPTINVLGEIGDFSRPSSGHLYFTLKEAGSELACVMFRSAAVRVRFEPQPGMEVIASGTLDVYMPRGSYQLYVRKLEPRGVGALELAFRQLKEKLEREGLFDASRKKPLPAVPQRIAVITSPTGAAIRDILQTLRRRFPALHILVFPVRVQGEGAALEIAGAIRAMNAHAARLGGIEAAIVGRGGGSLEDLWPFNEEVVARAIAASAIPIISAVGHETDISISDLVADVRAATPTAAAELIAPRVSDLLDWLDQRMRRVARGAGHTIQLARARLSTTLAYEGLARPLRRLRERAQMLDELQHRLQVAAYCRFRDARQRLNRAELALLRFRSGGALRRLDERVSDRLHRVLRGLIQPVRVRERLLANRLARLQRVSPERRLAAANEHLQQEMQRLHLGMRGILHARRERLERRLEALTAYSPQNVLNRGYSITRDAKTHEIIRSIDQIREGMRLITRVSDGEFRSRAEDPRQGRLFD